MKRNKNVRRWYRLDWKKMRSNALRLPIEPVKYLVRKGVNVKTAYRFLWAYERNEVHTYFFWDKIRGLFFPHIGEEEFFLKYAKEVELG